MEQFKVGQKVRLVRRLSVDLEVELGDVGTITEIRPDEEYPIVVQWTEYDHLYGVNRREIEVIELGGRYMKVSEASKIVSKGDTVWKKYTVHETDDTNIPLCLLDRWSDKYWNREDDEVFLESPVPEIPVRISDYIYKSKGLGWTLYKSIDNLVPDSKVLIWLEEGNYGIYEKAWVNGFTTSNGWAVRVDERYFCHFTDGTDQSDVVSYKSSDDKEKYHIFQSKEKADAVATLIGGVTEEVYDG